MNSKTRDKKGAQPFQDKKQPPSSQHSGIDSNPVSAESFVPKMEHVKTEGLGAAGLDPDSTHPAADPRYLVLARFIRFCSTILSTPIPQEAAALIVNRIGEIVRVDRAVLVKLKGGNPIVSVTGGGPAAQDSSFADAIEIVRRRYREGLETTLVPKVPEGEKNAMSHLWRVQQALGGTQILWLPLWLSKDNDVPPEYALWLERWQGRQWDKADIELLQHSALFLGHGLARHRPQKRSASRFKRIAVCAILFILLLMPVNASITAPARVIPDRPHHIFAPMDGILKDLLVRPGQWVEKEALLFRYDARVLDKRLDEAYRNVAVAKAKLVRLEGAAHRDPDARAELPVQQLEVERAEADARFFLSQRERSEVRTIQPGVIVLDDPDALIGAVIQTGQAVLSVADPAQHKLHIMVPASDAGFLKNGAQVSIRLDSQPLKSYSALVTRVGFEIKLSPDQVPSVLTEAIWVNAPPDVRPGQKGTAKIYGPSTILGKQIFRKPLIAIRQMTGF